MSEEILINLTPQETRVAVVENGVLQEIYIERHRHRGIVGNIYKGKVVRILPGMQAAFIDIGLERTAFLHEADIYTPPHAHDEVDEDNELAMPSTVAPKNVIPIQERLREGEFITVQVLKNPIGTKGARLTTALTIPARYLVYLPFSDHIGVSQRIIDEAERLRLRSTLIELSSRHQSNGGFIARTIAEGVSEDALDDDIRFLNKLWLRVSEMIKNQQGIGLIHEDIPLLFRTMRDLANDEIEKIRIDSKSAYERVCHFVSEVIPEVLPKIQHYHLDTPIFDLHSIDDEINNALNTTVSLKSGGYLVIDQTEAMTTIDVNTGGFVGRRNLEDTLFKTNLEAAQALARQLRLRNIGGIIIIDFIDMEDEAHKQQVLQALQKSLSKDKVKTQITEMSSLGLVEITRKRTRFGLSHVLCETCPTCKGRGHIKSADTTAFQIFREIIREARNFDVKNYLVIASEPVINILLEQEAQALQSLQEMIGKSINLQIDHLYHPEEYDLILM